MPDEPASAAPPARRDTGAVTSQRRRRWPLTIVAVVAVAAKADGLRLLLRHGSLVVIGPVTVILSLLATRPKGIAFGAGLTIAGVIHPASTLVGVGVGLAAWILLITLFVAIGAILQARQPLHGSDTRAA